MPRRIFGPKEEVDEVYGKIAYREASLIGFFNKYCLYDHMRWRMRCSTHTRHEKSMQNLYLKPKGCEQLAFSCLRKGGISEHLVYVAVNVWVPKNDYSISCLPSS